MTSSNMKRLFTWRRYLILFLTPILLCPLPIAVPGTESRCAYCILIMAIYWVSEVVPLAVTSLLPLVLFPLFGVLSSKEVAPPYFKDTNVLFVGGLIVAVAVEHWNLHKRIALRVLLLVGTQPRRLMLGFMLTTSFLSMWISNTATTAMMVPIAEAVLAELKQDKLNNEEGKQQDELQNKDDALDENIKPDAGGGGRTNDIELLKYRDRRHDLKTEVKVEEDGVVFRYNPVTNESDTVPVLSVDLPRGEQDEHEEDKFYTKMSKGLVLCVAYAANVGGTATLTGTGPNLAFSGQLQSLYPESPGIGFASWFMYAFPEMVILLFVAWAWLQFLFLGFGCCKRQARKDSTRAIKQMLTDQYRDLGPMSFAEIAVLLHFIILALLWLLRDPKFMPGWASAFKKGYARDATAAMLIAFSLFVFPSEKPKIFCWNPENTVTKPPRPLLDWKTVSLKLPWNVVILLGSGFAIAKACTESGLSKWLGSQLEYLSVVPSYGIVVIVCVMITFFTEFTSNVATATIFLPILAALGESICVHPLYLMIPATVSCSFAFMLPVATPPNAIVFSGGRLKVSDMAKAGLGMNIFCVIILIGCIHAYGVILFDLTTFPQWLVDNPVKNLTRCANVTA